MDAVFLLEHFHLQGSHLITGHCDANKASEPKGVLVTTELQP